MSAVGAAILGTTIGGAFNLGQSALNNQFAREQADRDRKQNYMYGEMAADAADARTRALYADLYSPQALMSQYKEAGLSPGMMFGGTPGGGGTSGAQGNGASGIQTPYMPISMLEGAQIANLVAQAEKTKAETEQIKPMSEATIAKDLAEAGHAKAAAAAAEAQAAGTKLDNYVKEHTTDANIYQICELAEQAATTTQKMYHEMRSAKVLADLDENLYETNLEKGKKELEHLAESITNLKANTRLTQEQKRAVRVDMLNSIDEIKIKWKELDIKERQQTTYSDWIEAQIPYIEKQLEAKFKELKIQSWKVAVDGVTNTIRAIAIGAAAASQFGKGGLQQPAMSEIGEPSQPYN